MAKLIAPDEIRVGFNKRSDTLTNMLGFMIYRNKADGNYGLEKSFTGWIDKRIPEKMIGNKFQSGFVINKGQKRFHSYGGNVKIRVYHPEGFEFEIPLDNLAVLLHNCSIEKSEIQEKCIIAWDGSNVNLIPEILAKEVEMKSIGRLKEKLGSRKYIPAASCLRFEFYETDSGIEFNLGKTHSYDVEMKNGLAYLNSGRSSQVSLPISYFDNNMNMTKSVNQGIIGSKKLREATVDSQLRDVVAKNKEILESRPSSHYYTQKESNIFLRHFEDRARIINPGFVPNNCVDNVIDNVSKILVSFCGKSMYGDKVVVIPQKVKFKENDYYLLIGGDGHGDYRFSKKSNPFYEKIQEGFSKIYNHYYENSFGKNSLVGLGVIRVNLVSAKSLTEQSNLLLFNDVICLPEIMFLRSYGVPGLDKNTAEVNIKMMKEELEFLFNL